MKRRTAVSLVLMTAMAGWTIGTPAHANSLDDALKVIDQFRADAAKDQAAPDKDQAVPAATPVAFIPPPRTISDITAILDKQKPDPAKRAALIAAADKQPPASGSPEELAGFYYARGTAAGEIGRAEQRLADIKVANDYAQKAGLPPKAMMTYLQQLGIAYTGAGNIKGALDANLARIPVADRSNQKGAYFNIYASIVLAAIRGGQMEVARDYQSRGERLLADSASWGLRGGGPSPLQRLNFRLQVLRSRGLVAFESGRYTDAEQAFRQAGALAEQLVGHDADFGIPEGQFASLRDGIHVELAKSLTRQGRLIEAEAEARNSLLAALKRHGRYAAETGQDIVALSSILYEEGRYAESEKLADAARDIFENLGHGKGSYALAISRRTLAQAQAAENKLQPARATYEAIERDVADSPELRRQFLDANLNYGVVLLRSGRPADALPIIERVVAQDEKNLGAKAYATAHARGWLAVAYARTQQRDKAAQEFAVSIPIMTASSREADDDDGGSVAQRDRQAQIITEAYLRLLAETKGSAAAAETFHLAEAVRGRSVERALAASSARAVASDAKLADLVRHEQDAQKQAAALQGMLTNALALPSNEQDAGALKKLREDIDKLRTARARVREEIEDRFPDYANLVDPRPATVEQAQKSLRPGEALITTYAGGDHLFVWAIPHQGPAAFAATAISDVDVEKLVTDLRKALDPNAATLDEVPAFDTALAYKLYEMLLKPVEAGWASAQSLMIVPHKALGQIPMALLVTEPTAVPAKTSVPFEGYRKVPFLVRKVGVSQLPSVASLATLRALPAPKGQREVLAAFGDPWFSPEEAAEAKSEQKVAQANVQMRGAKGGLQTRGIPLRRRSAPKVEGVDSAELAQLPRLPDTAEEVKSIALALHADPSKDVFLGDAANEKTVKTMDLANRKIIVFATHGLVPGDLNGLTQPALALSAPKVANVDGDGLLTMEEVLGLKLNADWVVLSACNTATGSGAGAEAVSGLGRAFFYAGTRALLVSNWPVETTSARTLTTDLFRRQADDQKLGRAEAMRQAELALIDGPGFVDPDSKQTLFSYAHPIFWAPFTVVGDGGISTQ